MNSERETVWRRNRRALPAAAILGTTLLLSFAGAEGAAADEGKFRACADKASSAPVLTRITCPSAAKLASFLASTSGVQR
jgi:hypothetical protein